MAPGTIPGAVGIGADSCLHDGFSIPELRKMEAVGGGGRSGGKGAWWRALWWKRGALVEKGLWWKRGVRWKRGAPVEKGRSGGKGALRWKRGALVEKGTGTCASLCSLRSQSPFPPALRFARSGASPLFHLRFALLAPEPVPFSTFASLCSLRSQSPFPPALSSIASSPYFDLRFRIRVGWKVSGGGSGKGERGRSWGERWCVKVSVFGIKGGT